MNVRQCRMARAALDWSQQDLAAASGVSTRTVIRYESGEPILPARAQALRHALESKGVMFIDSGHLAGGVIPPKGLSGRVGGATTVSRTSKGDMLTD